MAGENRPGLANPEISPTVAGINAGVGDYVSDEIEVSAKFENPISC